jgi:hypothetical protein
MKYSTLQHQQANPCHADHISTTQAYMNLAGKEQGALQGMDAIKFVHVSCSTSRCGQGSDWRVPQ